jgi:hypothetical protein
MGCCTFLPVQVSCTLSDPGLGLPGGLPILAEVLDSTWVHGLSIDPFVKYVKNLAAKECLHRFKQKGDSSHHVNIAEPEPIPCDNWFFSLARKLANCMCSKPDFLFLSR